MTYNIKQHIKFYKYNNDNNKNPITHTHKREKMLKSSDIFEYIIIIKII